MEGRERMVLVWDMIELRHNLPLRMVGKTKGFCVRKTSEARPVLFSRDTTELKDLYFPERS